MVDYQQHDMYVSCHTLWISSKKTNLPTSQAHYYTSPRAYRQAKSACMRVLHKGCTVRQHYSNHLTCKHQYSSFLLLTILCRTTIISRNRMDYTRICRKQCIATYIQFELTIHATQLWTHFVNLSKLTDNCQFVKIDRYFVKISLFLNFQVA